MMAKEEKKAPKLRFNGYTNDWEQVKLEEVVEITMGQSPSSKNYTNNSSDHILVQGNADMKNGHVEPRVWTTQITKQAKKGDLILSVRAPVGDIGKTDYDVVIGRGVAAIKGNEYIFQVLIKMKDSGYWTRFSTGSTFESINSSNIRNAQIMIPKDDEQTKIAKVLTFLDNTIQLHERKCEELALIKKALLQKLFPKKDEFKPEVRYKNFSDAWEQRKLGDISKTKRGLTYKPSNIDNTGIRVLRSSNIKEDTFVISDNDVFVKESAVNIPFVKNGDILITAANGSTNLVGKHAIIRDIPKNSAVHGGFMLITTSKEYEFLNASMSSNWYKKFIKKYVAGGNGAIGNLRKNDLDNQKIYVPKKDEQEKIGNFFKMLDSLITLHQRKLEKLKQLKKFLLQNMFI